MLPVWSIGFMAVGSAVYSLTQTGGVGIAQMTPNAVALLVAVDNRRQVKRMKKEIEE